MLIAEQSRYYFSATQAAVAVGIVGIVGFEAVVNFEALLLMVFLPSFPASTVFYWLQSLDRPSIPLAMKSRL